jgi:hypothetical protein
MPLFRSIACCVALLCAGSSHSTDCGESRLDAAAAGSLVDTVERQVAESHVGSAGGVPASVLAGFGTARLVAGASPRKRELADALNMALAPLRDAHLEVRMLDETARTCRALPIHLAWNSAGLWVLEGTAAVPRGSRITALGSKAVTELEAELALRIPHETPQWVRAHGAGLLPRIDTLRNLGLVVRGDAVTVRYVPPGGSARTARLEIEPQPESAAKARAWVGFRLYPEHATGLFWFDRFDYDAELVAQFDEFLRAAAGAGVRKVAIDIRGNPGGDSSVAVAILDALGLDGYTTFTVVPRASPVLAAAVPMLMPAAMNPVFAQAGLPAIPLDAATYELPAPLVLAELRSRVAQRPVTARLTGRQLFLLTDAGTFSSGTLFAVLVKDNELGRIVGESPGNSASFNGTEHAVNLPGTDYYLNLTLARLLRPDVGAPADGSIEPDDPVVPTGVVIAAGQDAALERVLAAP